MPVKIENIISGSYAEKAGIITGDIICSVNGHEIFDVLDYRFFIQGRKLNVEVERGDEKLCFNIRKSDEFADIGLEFETYLMDKQHSCKNKCIFCFIDQMPCGMRDSLYFKDDDSRLSFLFGNYITLTALSEREIERIIDMHISPMNVSVHTMNPELRVKMMKNPSAGEALKIIDRFTDNRIEINAQLVLCPGINDGDELRFSLEELSKHSPFVRSIAVVPVGLTKYREGLPQLRTYSKKEANEVIAIVDEFNAHYEYYNNGARLAYASDEFYITAGRDIPDAGYYGEFAQLDNGVGVCALLKSEFEDALADIKPYPVERKVTVATGEAAYELISHLAQLACEKFSGLSVTTVKIKNDFFGHTVTVAGLLTAQDILAQLQNVPLGDELLIPRVSLRSDGDRFLDDVTPSELSQKLGVKVTAVENDGEKLLSAILGGV